MMESDETAPTPVMGADVQALERQAQAAQQRGDWPQVASLWAACRETGTGLPRLRWLLGEGWALHRVQRHAEAVPLFAEAIRLYPQHRGGFHGRAACLTQLEQWAEAEAAWARLLRRFPEAPGGATRRSYALCLNRLGRSSQAIKMLDDAPGAADDFASQHLKSALLLRRRNLPEALALTNRLLQTAPTHFALHRQHLWILTAQRNLAAARIALSELLRLAATPDELGDVLIFVPQLHEGTARQVILAALQQRLAAMPDEDGAATVLSLRLLLARQDHAGFLSAIAAAGTHLTHPLLPRLRRSAALLAAAPHSALAGEKIFGIGLSKTGTTSLAHALEMLGLQNAHFTNEFTGALLTTQDALLFDALSDTPVSHMFEALYHMFPRAKFIYTIRSTTRWQSSYTRHFAEDFASGGLAGPDPLFGTPLTFIHAALYPQHLDPLSAYAAHDHRVRSFFAANDASRLLVFDAEAGDGWEKLCPFLNRPIPAAPFPWVNKSTGQ